MDLETIRENIDRIDSMILNLLQERLEQGLLAGRVKSKIEDRQREEALLTRVRGRAAGPMTPAFAEGLFDEILKESKRIQRKKSKLIAFQGEHGAYGERAAAVWAADLIPIPCRAFDQVFAGVESGLYDYGIVPLENTLGGVVGQVNELLIRFDLYVVGAVELAVHHCLLAVPGTDPREVRRVYSHPQALAQCRGFLLRHRIEPVAYEDTAGAARMLSQKRPAGSAAIGSEWSATLYGLDVLKEKIEDHETNRTRFLILARESNREAGEK